MQTDVENVALALLIGFSLGSVCASVSCLALYVTRNSLQEFAWGRQRKKIQKAQDEVPDDEFRMIGKITDETGKKEWNDKNFA